jgi:hypothetical protein
MFEEGDDELTLIDDIKVESSLINIIDNSCGWKVEDDELLKTLLDKQCSPSVIAAVFKLDEESIVKRIEKLKVLKITQQPL